MTALVFLTSAVWGNCADIAPVGIRPIKNNGKIAVNCRECCESRVKVHLKEDEKRTEVKGHIMRKYKKITMRTTRLQRRQRRYFCCHGQGKAEEGFTLVEILLVVLIMAIAAIIAIPMIGSTDSMQVRSAANMIASDLEYAKSMAISRQENYSVVFPAGNYYEVHDTNGVVKNPITKLDYKVDFSSVSRLKNVVVENVNFDDDATKTITFDSLGGPHHGVGASPAFLNGQGTISIKAGGVTETIKIEPVTGFISIE